MSVVTLQISSSTAVAANNALGDVLHALSLDFALLRPLLVMCPRHKRLVRISIVAMCQLAVDLGTVGAVEVPALHATA